MRSLVVGAALVLLGLSRPLEAQPRLVKDINVTAGVGSSLTRAAFLAPQIYFGADDGINGLEPWVSDGTTAGTKLLKDVCPGSCGSAAGTFTEMGGAVYFFANVHELWKTDGTESGTVLVKDLGLRTAEATPVNLSGALYFVTCNSQTDCGRSGYIVWKTDGTTAGTTQLATFPPQGFLIRSTHTLSLTATSTSVFAIESYPASLFYFWSRLSVVNDSGATLLIDTNPITSVASLGSELYFMSTSYSSAPSTYSALYKSDGTVSGTTLARQGLAPESWPPGGLIVISGALYLNNFDTAGGSELWKSGAGVGGISVLKDICPGSCSSIPRNLTEVSGGLFFSATDGQGGDELWKSDGTAGGTLNVRDIRPGAADSSPANLIGSGGRAYFDADDGVHGRELWQSDGSTAGTTLVQDFEPGSAGGSVTMIAATPLGLFFSPTSSSLGHELYLLPPATISVDDASVVEGGAAGTIMSFTVSLSEVSTSDVTVNYATSDGTAAAGSDYIAATGTFTIPAGSLTRQLTIRIAGDAAVEPSETFTLTLSNPVGMTLGKSAGIGTIVDDDPAPAATTLTQYRLYSPVTLEHLYTTDLNEYTVLGGQGWNQEGVAYHMFTNGVFGGVDTVPLFRLYHPGIRQHHWTTDSNEALVLSGTTSWSYEGVIGYLLPSQVSGSVPLYRMSLANPPLHLWTTDQNEYETLATRGWVKEGVVGYVIP